ncbi:hypothetical protein UFOVP139_57 [uncultured Caudovirales phage]|uniref:Uncharacterized protein n=1 Tax=uncultured Caudovirales phage TaxID=2100421 RepID=A0A6J5LF45_9CAUD|nr:hypothetical protein UFOVP139_57 [uncultured Caudovirales phage]
MLSNPKATAALHARMFDNYGSDIEIQSLDQSTTPPVYKTEKTVKGVIMSYLPNELLGGAIPENSHRVLLLNRDLADYSIKTKSDRLIIQGKPYVPQAVNEISRMSSNTQYATEVRVVG